MGERGGGRGEKGEGIREKKGVSFSPRHIVPTGKYLCNNEIQKVVFKINKYVL